MDPRAQKLLQELELKHWFWFRRHQACVLWAFAGCECLVVFVWCHWGFWACRAGSPIQWCVTRLQGDKGTFKRLLSYCNSTAERSGAASGGSNPLGHYLLLLLYKDFVGCAWEFCALVYVHMWKVGCRLCVRVLESWGEVTVGERSQDGSALSSPVCGKQNNCLGQFRLWTQSVRWVNVFWKLQWVEYSVLTFQNFI